MIKQYNTGGRVRRKITISKSDSQVHALFSRRIVVLPVTVVYTDKRIQSCRLLFAETHVTRVLNIRNNIFENRFSSN